MYSPQEKAEIERVINQIKYSGSFYNNINGLNVGGKNYPRYAIYANNNTAFCLEPGVHLVGGDTVYASGAHVWSGFSSDTREAIRTALVCGEPGSSGSLSGSFGSQYTATALIIWELVTGCRSSTPPYSVWDSKVVKRPLGTPSSARQKILTRIFLPGI